MRARDVILGVLCRASDCGWLRCSGLLNFPNFQEYYQRLLGHLLYRCYVLGSVCGFLRALGSRKIMVGSVVPGQFSPRARHQKHLLCPQDRQFDGITF